MPDTDRLTLAQFISRAGITAMVEPTDRNPNVDDSDDWARRADHWRVTLRRGRQRLTVYFSKGSGLNGEPATAEEVLNSLALDSASIENARTFEEWATELGYGPDSRKAERIYRLCARQSNKLLRFLGVDLFETLLWHTENL